jgi:hypothetical protein
MATVGLLHGGFEHVATLRGRGWAARYKVLVAAVAVPHVVVRAWLDRTQGTLGVH